MKKTITIGLPLGPFMHLGFIEVEIPGKLFWLLFISGIALVIFIKFW